MSNCTNGKCEWCPGKCKKKCCFVKVLIILAIVALGLWAFGTYAQYWYNPDQWSWGWGNSYSSSSSLVRDVCPDGDYTFSYYDGYCDDDVKVAAASTVTATEATGNITTQVVTSTDVSVIEYIQTAKEDLIKQTEQTTSTTGTIVLPTFLPETGSNL